MSAAVRLDIASPALRSALVEAGAGESAAATRRAAKPLRVAGPPEILAVDDDHADFDHLPRFRR